MGGTQQSQPAGPGVSGGDAAAELAEIRRRQQQVIRAALVPAWFWWLFAAALVAIGAARDSHDRVVLAVTIPLAVLVMIGLVVTTIPGVRRRVRVHNAVIPGAQTALAIIGLNMLVDTVTVVASLTLTEHHVPHPLTIGYAAGAAVLVLAGLLVNRYLGRFMVSRVQQPLTEAPSRYSGLFGGPDGGTA
jgi:hypothetical protein